MEEQQKEIVMTKNNQPIKEITHQDMYLLNEVFDQLHSRKEVLAIINRFSDNRKIPLNKKKIMKEFHSSSYIFNAFYQDFLANTTTLEQQIEELKNRPKVRIEKSFAILLDSEGRELYFTTPNSFAATNRGHVTLNRSEN
ncbi:hypothetical protein P7G42_08840 [Enterococcus faecalis]|uniref:hypothetical protein n=1 Tax=Enterococcus faecalis TaxID=1351 RepID=UPI002241BDF6|nr:hypothetical protein [Enterococcus faecalis]MDT2052333.1 hypothetical protein [Enterococcus faecalis]WDA18246.1 hypothetical protein PSC77_13050 [Enterococcus faecalis]